MNSKRRQLLGEDLKRIARNFLLAVLSAVAAAGLTFLPQTQAVIIDFVESYEGISTFVMPFITVFFVTFFDSIRRYLTDYSK